MKPTDPNHAYPTYHISIAVHDNETMQFVSSVEIVENITGNKRLRTSWPPMLISSGLQVSLGSLNPAPSALGAGQVRARARLTAGSHESHPPTAVETT